jgi:hypothetical protein
MKVVKLAVQGGIHGYHIMKGVNLVPVQGFRFIPMTKHLEYREDCCSIILWNDR